MLVKKTEYLLWVNFTLSLIVLRGFVTVYCSCGVVMGIFI